MNRCLLLVFVKYTDRELRVLREIAGLPTQLPDIAQQVQDIFAATPRRDWPKMYHTLVGENRE